MSQVRTTPTAVQPGPIARVDGPDDPRLDLYRNLNDPAARARIDVSQAVFVVEGRRAVDRLLTSDYRVHSLLVDDHQVTAAGDLVATARSRGAPVLVGSRDVVAATVGFDLHRGVVAIAHRPTPTDAAGLLLGVGRPSGPASPPSLTVLLEGLNDHENIGAVFRNAAAFGVAGVLLDPTCGDPLYRRSVRVSVGHVLHVPFARLSPWPAAVDRVRQAGFIIAALVPHPGDDRAAPAIGLAELKARISDPGRPAGAALLLGAEGTGLSERAVAESDAVVSIPMADGVDSLNVATAAAVALHTLAGR